MQAKIISTLRWLSVDAEPGTYEMMPGISIINDRQYIKEQLDLQFQTFAGRIECDHLLGADHIVACRPEEASIWEGYEHSEPLLLTWLAWLSLLIEDSWLVKDNAIGCEMAHCNFRSNGKVFWTSNGLYSTISKANGEALLPTAFNADEIELWRDVTLELRAHLHEKGFSAFQSPVSKDSSRFDRFLSFMTSSRKVHHPSLKIAQVCSALESLFSTSTSELTHRLSERVAHFLGGSSQVMESRYQFMKKAYTIRSQVTHGSHIRASDIEASASISQGLQDICREIVFMVLRVPEKQDVVYGSNEQIEDYFRRQLFS
ncbi:HEPN domain-containing protein [Pseudomonas sp. 39004]|uniref:HEPN domain-containing protein n=1 Tax=Pseudomonas sp. 39004 TaxID=2967213 RepID=UPI002363C2C6|nr:HEPN domain-containing protein [Pseudomonas sp. 39004]MDD1959009.1 HEPN domain-containing protein [Pseudomonas sp. 39004]